MTDPHYDDKVEEIMKFRKKPVIVEAFKCSDLLNSAKNSWSNLPPCIAGASGRGELVFLDGRIQLKTLEGWMNADFDDWIIQGVKYELYPCKPDIFEVAYEPVDT